MFRSIVAAISKSLAMAKKPAVPTVLVSAEAAPIPDGGRVAAVTSAAPEEIWTPENVIIPERDLSEAEEIEIRTNAYELWEAAGKPNGHQARYWLEARKQLLEGS